MQHTKQRSLRSRLLSCVSALATAAALLPQMPALKAAAETYNLKIDGIPVTDSNKEDILGDGVFSYDSFANTLTVNGNYTASTDNIIFSNITNLTVNVAGDSVLTETGDYPVITLFAAATFTGTGKLTLIDESEKYPALYSKSGLTISSINMDVSSAGSNGILFSYPNNLTVNSAQLHVTARAGFYAIENAKNFSLSCCDFLSPANCTLESGSSLASDGSIADEIANGNFDLPLNYERTNYFVFAFAASRRVRRVSVRALITE